MEGWTTQKLINLCTVFGDGDWIETKDQSESGIRLVQTGNVGVSKFKDRAEKARYISNETFKRLRCTEVFEGDILISRLPDPVGRACIIPELDEQCITAVDCTIIRLETAKILPEFITYYFQSPCYFNAVQDKVTGATRQRISRKSLGLIEIPLPPLPVQKAIVAKLDAAFASIDIAIAAAERNAENADKLYKTEVDSIFNNLSYELLELGNNAEISYGYTAKSSSQYDGPHYLRITDIQNNDVNWNDVPRCMIGEKEFKKFQLTTGDIVFARTGATTGKSFLLSASPPAVFASYLIKVAANKSVFRPEFIYQYFQSASYWDFVNAGISGAAQGGFNASKLSSLPIPLPPLDEQDIAVVRLLDFQSHTKQLVEIYIRKAKAMTQLKQSLLQQAFTGQLVDA